MAHNPPNEYSCGNLRHITRFTYKFTNFQGWRVAISRQGITLARYFSDKQYGDPETACQHALLFRNAVLDELRCHPEQTREILDKYRIKPKKLYPAGLKPCNTQTEYDASGCEPKVSACSMRSNKVLHGILKRVCQRFQLDTASVLKLSLYLFALQYSEAADMVDGVDTPHVVHAKLNVDADEIPEADDYLQRMIAQLESRAALAGMPSFEEFSTGKGRPLQPVYGVTPPPGAELPRVEPQPPVLSMRSSCPSPPSVAQHLLKPAVFVGGTELTSAPAPDYY